MQQSNRPAKMIVPIAQNDSSKATIPVTTADATRASQTAGFPPVTGQPPEAGGTPPTLPDMNGLLNLVSRLQWWLQMGGGFPYDATFASDGNINGYPMGANIASVDGLGSFISLTEDNGSNPDANGAGWAPGYHYGAAGLSGLTGGTVVLTQAQAAKTVITLGGTLTSNLVLVVPNWIRQWTFYNVTTGGFTVSVRTATGGSAVIPANSAPTPITCDGTNCSQWAPNLGVGTSASQAVRLDQMTGRLLNVQRFTANGTYTPTAGATRAKVIVVGGGGGGGACSATAAGQTSLGGSGGGGGYAIGMVTVSGPVAVTVGVGGTGGSGSAAGSAGGDSSFGTALTATGGAGGGTGGAVTPVTATGGTGGGSGAGGSISNGSGSSSSVGLHLNATTAVAGLSGTSLFGGAVSNAGPSNAGQNGGAPGAGGSGAVATQSQIARNGGAGAAGVVIIEEYA